MMQSKLNGKNLFNWGIKQRSFKLVVIEASIPIKVKVLECLLDQLVDLRSIQALSNQQGHDAEEIVSANVA